MSQHRAPTITASARFVPITLRRIRTRTPFATIRGPMIIATIGPRPNITNGLRSRR